MGRPFGSGGVKRKSAGNVAGRYLAAIGACGEQEDPTLSPKANARPDTTQKSQKKKSGGSTKAPEKTNIAIESKIPTKKEPRLLSFMGGPSPNVSASTEQDQLQHSPSLATAPTLENCSQSWATSTSPSRGGTPGRPSPRGSPQQLKRKKQPAGFFSIFPSTKIALRSKSQQAAIAAAKRSPPPPPPPPSSNAEQEGTSSVAVWESHNKPQHLQDGGADDIELVLEGGTEEAQVTRKAPERSPNRPFQMMSDSSHKDSSMAGASEVLSELFSATGAPTEVITNRAVDRIYVLNPDEALWKKKKKGCSNTGTSSNTSSWNSNKDFGDWNDEEKKQDSSESSFGPKQDEDSIPSDEQTVRQDYEGNPVSDDDLLLYGPVPLERTNTRRTSNRGKFIQSPNAAYPPYPQHAQLPSQIKAQQRLQQQQQQQHQQQNQDHLQGKNHQSSQEAKRNQPQGSPLEHRFQFQGSPQRQKNKGSPKQQSSPFVRHKQLFDAPTDVRSLLSASTNTDESSSVLSPQSQSLLNPIVEAQQSKLNSQQKQQSQQQNEEEQKTAPSKAVVAYPDSPPSYMKQRNVVAAGKSKKDESFVSQNSDAGVIGQFDDDSDGPKQGHTGTPFTAADAAIPKLAPNQKDLPKKASQKTGQQQHAAQPQPSQEDRDQQQPHPKPMLQLQPRPSRNKHGTGQEGDPNRTVASESTGGLTPMTMSETGLNFSDCNDAPLLPLFSQDRYDFFGHQQNGGQEWTTPFQKSQSATATNVKKATTQSATTPLERKIIGAGRDQVASAKQQQQPQHRDQQWEQQIARQPKALVEAKVRETSVSPEQQGSRNGSCPGGSSEIWRRGEQDDMNMNSLVSPDPIFCTQPSASQPSTMVPSFERTSSIVTSESSSAPPYQKQGPKATPSSPNRNPAEAPPEIKNNCPRQEALGTPPRPPVTRTGGQRLESAMNSIQSHGLPRRTASGPVSDQGCGDYTCDGTVSSRQVETGAESVATHSTGSVPRRSKSETCIGAKSGSFRAAFAAFEKRSCNLNKASLPKNAHLESNANSDAHNKASRTSRLTLVLDAHLAKTSNEAADGDGVSVDIQSIRSAFESVGNPVPDDDDDDDSGSVKSLKEVYESAGAEKTSENAVSKMRALFENKKAPTAKSFETRNADLRNAWNKFESNKVRPKRRQFKKSADSQSARSEGSTSSHHTDSDTDGNEPFLRNQDDPNDEKVEQNQKSDKVSSSKPLTEVQKKTMSSLRERILAFQGANGKLSAHRTCFEQPETGRGETIEGGHKPAVSHQDEATTPVEAVNMERNVDSSRKLRHATDPLGQNSETSNDSSIPSDKNVLDLPPDKDEQPFGANGNLNKTQAMASGDASSDEIISPPRLGIQGNPREDVKSNDVSPNAVIYPLKDFSPSSKSSKQRHGSYYSSDRHHTAASESEFSDGVTLDLSIADVSQLTNPTAIQSKTGDDSTVGDVSTGEKTVVIDLLDCEAKRSEASSSQMTEAAAPLIERAMKRLSDDMSLESRNQMAKIWEESTLLGQKSTSGEDHKSMEHEGLNGWDLRYVEASFPLKESHDSFGFGGESKEEWHIFENDSSWSTDPFKIGDLDVNDFNLKDSPVFHVPSEANKGVNSVSEPENAVNRHCVSPSWSSPSRWNVHGKTSLCSGAHAGDPKSPCSLVRDSTSHLTFNDCHVNGRERPRSPIDTVYGTSPHRPTGRSPRFDTTVNKGSGAIDLYPMTRSPQAVTPPRSPSSQPTTPTHCPVTPTRLSVTPPSSHPVTPTHRSVTPTMNNLHGNNYFGVTPKASHSFAQKRQPSETELSQRFNDAFVAPAPTFHETAYGWHAPQSDELNHDGFFSDTGPTRGDLFYSQGTQSQSNVFFSPSLPAGDLFPTPSDKNFYSPSKNPFRTSMVPSATPSPQGGMFHRTHPVHNAPPQSKNAYSPRNVQSNPYYPRQNHPDFRAPPEQQFGGHQASGKFATVVGKHAALMARLKLLKASRARRSQVSSSGGLEERPASEGPKSTFGRAINAVYTFGKGQGTTNTSRDNKNPHSPHVEVHQTTVNPRPAFSLPVSKTKAPDYEDCSVSTKSSTHYGGRAFTAMLEVE